MREGVVSERAKKCYSEASRSNPQMILATPMKLIAARTIRLNGDKST
jgi:hypothetical protein